MSWFITIVLLSELAITVFFSFRARTHRDPLKKGLNFARMNMMVGVLFLTLSFTQLFLSPYSYWRIAFAIFVLLIGLYNLFVGIRNHGYYTRMLDGDARVSSADAKSGTAQVQSDRPEEHQAK